MSYLLLSLLASLILVGLLLHFLDESVTEYDYRHRRTPPP